MIKIKLHIHKPQGSLQKVETIIIDKGQRIPIITL